MNKSAKGAALERGIIHTLLKHGFSCVKGAGSKSYGPGKIDIVAINPQKKEIWLLQAKNHKRNALSVGEKERSGLWQTFNPDFSKQSYTMRCELITSVEDLRLLDAGIITMSNKT